MIRGETVWVLDRSRTGVDAHGNALYESKRVEVEDVLVCPRPPREAPEDNRPNGAVVAFTLHFPKSYDGDLYGKSVEVRGRTCRVLGRPMRYASGNVPGRWNMAVEAEAVDG